jgi:cell division septal protein FtsQ
VVPLRARRRSGRLGSFLPSALSLSVGIALVVVAAGAYALARGTSLFALETVRITGGTPAIARQVRDVLDRDRGSSLLALDAGLLGRVEALPEVRSASYDRAFPHALVVTVRRELPAAVLRRGGDSWLLSERGRVLRPLPRAAHPRLPRVWAVDGPLPTSGDLLVQRGVAAPMRIVGAIPEGFPVRVRSVALERGLGLLVLDGGLELRLGEPTDLAAKLAVAAAVLPELERPADGGPDYLDVSLPERPVSGANPQLAA